MPSLAIADEMEKIKAKIVRTILFMFYILLVALKILKINMASSQLLKRTKADFSL
jgi:hypothetical protein